MQKEPQIISQILFANIISFNMMPKYDKSSTELIKGGLNVFSDVPGVVDAALFMMEENEFDFYYKSSFTAPNTSGIKEVFDKLTKEGGILAVLKTGEIANWELRASDGKISYQTIVPLIVPKGIIGLLILLLEIPFSDKKIIDLLYLHANYFASVINNLELIRELENIKEITEQKIAYKTMNIVQSTRELKLILDSVQAGVLIIDKRTELIADLNLAAATLIGSSKEKLVGTPRRNYFYLAKTTFQLNGSQVMHEGLLKNNRGSLIPIIRTANEMTFENREFIVETFMEISERKKMEEELQAAHFKLEQKVEERTLELSETNRKLQKEIQDRIKAEEELLKLYWAVEQSPNPIMLTDINGVIEYVNPVFTDITGYKFEELIGNTPRILKSGMVPSEEYERLWNNITKGIQYRGEFLNKKKNGELYWSSVTISPILGIGGEIKHYLEIQEDISERKRFEMELVRAKDKAEQSDRLKSTLLSNMSHEFRTPLISILGFSQILREDAAFKEHAEMVENIQLSGKRLLNTLNDILSFSQLEADDIKPNFNKTDLIEFFNKEQKTFSKPVENSKLRFNLKITEKSVFCKTDVHLLQTALTKIIDNAVKFTPQGTVDITLSIVTKPEQNFICIKVTDTGIGITEANQKIIFEAFRQVSEGYSRNFEGCGLGLTIAQKTIRLLGGEITVESYPGQGSSFNIFLPPIS